MIMSILLCGCGKEKIDCTQFVEVSVQGINGRATANVEFDMVALEEILTFNKENIQPAEVLDIISLEESIKCELDISEGLSNGDIIKVSIVWDEEAAEDCGIVLTGNEMVVEVSGLDNGVVLDVFENIEIVYSGTAPEIEAEVNLVSTDTSFRGISYSISPDRNISNGDVLTVVAEADWDSLEQRGYIVSETERQITVEGQDEYVQTYNDIDEKLLSEMNACAMTHITEVLTSSDYGYRSHMYPNEIRPFLDKGEVVEIKQDSAYYFMLKEGQDKYWGQSTNKIFFVYEVTAVDNDSPNGKITYFVICFQEIIKQNTGGCMVETLEVEYVYDTYNTKEEVYEDIVTENIEEYKFEEIEY